MSTDFEKDDEIEGIEGSEGSEPAAELPADAELQKKVNDDILCSLVMANEPESASKGPETPLAPPFCELKLEGAEEGDVEEDYEDPDGLDGPEEPGPEDDEFDDSYEPDDFDDADFEIKRTKLDDALDHAEAAIRRADSIIQKYDDGSENKSIEDGGNFDENGVDFELVQPLPGLLVDHALNEDLEIQEPPPPPPPPPPPKPIIYDYSMLNRIFDGRLAGRQLSDLDLQALLVWHKDLKKTLGLKGDLYSIAVKALQMDIDKINRMIDFRRPKHEPAPMVYKPMAERSFEDTKKIIIDEEIALPEPEEVVPGAYDFEEVIARKSSAYIPDPDEHLSHVDSYNFVGTNDVYTIEKSKMIHEAREHKLIEPEQEPIETIIEEKVIGPYDFEGDDSESIKDSDVNIESEKIDDESHSKDEASQDSATDEEKESDVYSQNVAQ